MSVGREEYLQKGQESQALKFSHPVLDKSTLPFSPHASYSLPLLGRVKVSGTDYTQSLRGLNLHFLGIETRDHFFN